MPTTNTLSAASVNMILSATRQQGIDTDTLIEAVGISPDCLRDPDGRLPIRQVQAIWRELSALTNTNRISLRLGELINPSAVGVVAYVMMHSPTLDRAIKQLCRYQDIICDGTRLLVRQEGDQVALVSRITSADIVYPALVYNSELSIVLSAFRALTGLLVTPTEVRFAYPQPADVREHERAFAPARLVFDAPETALVLPASLLDTPVLNASPGMMPLFEQHANALLNRLTTPSLAGRVRNEIVTLMKGEEPTLTAVADRLAIGVRTLQGHLRSEGLTYQNLLDEVRKELAQRHLRDPFLSTTDIAYLLGYAEPSVFFRSFKKWTGQTPGAYRQLAR
ncbi:AraC family transcriptional regulator [Spirosoma rhododendri]|uniref:AraC family transcriptional regulator n=1 Tax=Spirosoma rhododendri TaxID=2728024 RepID=A0A7L5DZA8_9BACT|nr:AraC family transcriptional regulator [Spirosoma rhododendri]